MTDYAIDVEGVTKTFGDKTVVNGISMRVRKGEIYGFLGPNGSGKTTFIRMLCGLLKPDSGKGTCLGHDFLREPEQIKLKVGYMPQKFSLYEDLTVLENLDFIARMYGLRDRILAVKGIMDQMYLGPFAHQLAGTLSGGWKQRLALASCLMHEPSLLLLDEPTAGVDPKARRDFWDNVHALAAKGLTVLIVTHYMDEAERCHRLAYIAYGNLLASGTAGEVIKKEHLTTWRVSGPGLVELSQEISALSGVDQAVAFGNNLHVSGRDEKKLEASVGRFIREPYTWKKVDPSLEEVFISLMSGVKEV